MPLYSPVERLTKAGYKRLKGKQQFVNKRTGEVISYRQALKRSGQPDPKTIAEINGGMRKVGGKHVYTPMYLKLRHIWAKNNGMSVTQAESSPKFQNVVHRAMAGFGSTKKGTQARRRKWEDIRDAIYELDENGDLYPDDYRSIMSP
jgi:hypothetical protein